MTSKQLLSGCLRPLRHESIQQVTTGWTQQSTLVLPVLRQWDGWQVSHSLFKEEVTFIIFCLKKVQIWLWDHSAEATWDIPGAAQVLFDSSRLCCAGRRCLYDQSRPRLHNIVRAVWHLKFHRIQSFKSRFRLFQRQERWRAVTFWEDMQKLKIILRNQKTVLEYNDFQS